METVNFWVDIESSWWTGHVGDGIVRKGAGPLRPQSWRQTARLDGCGEFSFTVSGADPNISALAEKRNAFCYYVIDGQNPQIFGSGVIDKIVKRFDETGALWLDVSGNDLGRELSNRTVASVSLSEDGAGVNYGPALLILLTSILGTGWSLSGEQTTQTNVYAGFDGESLLTALTKIAEHIGEHFRLEPGRHVNWLGTAADFDPCGLRAVRSLEDPSSFRDATDVVVITSLEEESDAANVVTMIMPRGSGNGGAIVNLSTCTDSPPSGYVINTINSGTLIEHTVLYRTESVLEYGYIERALDFKEIGPLSNTTADIQSASNMLLQAGVEWLRRYGMPQKFYRLGLMANEMLQPGTTLRVVYKHYQDGVALYDLDDVFNILDVTHDLNESGAYTTGVTISTIDRLPQSDASYLAGEMQSAKVLSTHQQLGASTDTLTWRDEMDDAHGATMRFWLGDEYTSIQRAVFRFRIQPLRSTVKSVGASSGTTGSGGGTTATSSSGGGTSSTSGDGGGTTQSSSSGGGSTETSTAASTQTDIEAHHTHYVNSAPGTSADGGSHSHAVDSHDHSLTIPSHTHSVTIPDHNHSITIADHTHSVTVPDHTHTVTPTINMVYGIFEESGANTLALADLVIKLNGGSDIRANAEDIGSGWYALELTEYGLLDVAFRPAAENNYVAITTAVEKTARIEAQLTIRGVVQAVNYS